MHLSSIATSGFYQITRSLALRQRKTSPQHPDPGKYFPGRRHGGPGGNQAGDRTLMFGDQNRTPTGDKIEQRGKRAPGLVGSNYLRIGHHGVMTGPNGRKIKTRHPAPKSQLSRW